MSADVMCLRSTFCRNQFWDKLPPEMAVEIYSFLSMRDKRNMSLTCKSWLAAFEDPRTWRKSHFVFTGKKSSKGDIPDEVLSSLQYVTIDCSLPRYDVSYKYTMEKTNRFVKFVVDLNESRNTTLQTLNILDMQELGHGVTQTQLRLHLRKLLAKQTKLCSLTLFNGGLTTAQGLTLLTAAGKSNAHCLKYLNVHNFAYVTFPLQHDLTFAELCGTFTNLTELNLNFSYMSDDLLNNLSGTLKLIIVWMDIYNFDSPAFDDIYSNNGWDVLVSKCTGLKAEFHVGDFAKYLELSPSVVLLPAVPLASFNWFSWAPPNKIRPSFDDIINTFKNGLEHVHVNLRCNFLSKGDIADVVERCPLLKTFSINGTSVPIQRIPQHPGLKAAEEKVTD